MGRVLPANAGGVGFTPIWEDSTRGDQLSLHAAAPEPRRPEASDGSHRSPRAWGLCSTREAAAMSSPCITMRSGHHLPQPVEARTHQQRPGATRINKKVFKKILKREREI